LGHIFGIEGVAAEAGVAEEIARRARGGMRDALSMADQLLSLVGSNPTLADVARLAEGGGTREIEQLIERIEAHDRAGMLRALPRTEGSEADLVAALLDTVRGALLAHVAGADSGIVEGDAERRLKLSALGERLGLERAQVWLEELIQCRERIRTMPAHGRVVLEVTLLDLCREETSWSVGEVLQRLKALEHAVGGGQAQVLPPRIENSARVESDVVVPKERPPPATKEPARAAGGGASLIDPGLPTHAVETRKPTSGSLASRPRGTAEIWAQFLDALVLSSSSLAETLA
jgi:DNA polymerase III gamma/tau subunit